MKTYMTKKEAERLFKELYNNDLSKFKHDKPALRESWNNFTDCLCKDGHISSNQYMTWSHPKFIKG